MMNKNKKRLSKIIFILSFIPYIIMILFSLYFAIGGEKIYTFMSHEYIRTDYGMPVFIKSMSMLVYIGTFKFPILPILIIYQIVFILNIIRKKENKNKPQLTI